MKEGNAKWNALADRPETKREARAEAARVLRKRTAKIISSRNKLTPEEREAACLLVSLGVEPAVDVARKFGIDQSTLSRLLQRRGLR